MRGVLVDTDVFSYLFKADTRAALYLPHLRGEITHIAFATVAELYRWAIKSNWGAPRVNDLLQSIKSFTILGYDDATAWHWASVRTIGGRPMSVGDAWIAAVALRHGLPLITHNRKDYEFIPGLTILSEA